MVNCCQNDLCKLNAMNEGLSKNFCEAWPIASKGNTTREELWTEARVALCPRTFHLGRGHIRCMIEWRQGEK